MTDWQEYELDTILNDAQDAVEKLDALAITIEDTLPSCDDCDYNDAVTSTTVSLFTEATESHSTLSDIVYHLRNERERVRNADDE